MPPSAPRRVHLTGSLPGSTSREAMQLALDAAGSFLRALPDGETGPRNSWVMTSVAGFAGLDAVEAANPGASGASYQDLTHYRVRAGAALTAAAIGSAIPVASAAAGSWPVFRELRASYGLPGLDFQVGLPSPADLGWLALGDAGLQGGVYEEFTAAYAAQVGAVHQLAGSEVVFQVEPATLTARLAMLPAAGKQAFAEDAARRITGLPLSCPPGTRWGVHLCLGDLGHQAFVHPESAADVVLLAGEIAARWPAGRPLGYIQFPLAAAADPFSLDPAYYAPFSALKLPPETRIVAGFVHEGRTLPQHRQILDVIEGYAGTRVDVATTCGLGRRPEPGQVEDALAKCVALTQDGT